MYLLVNDLDAGTLATMVIREGTEGTPFISLTMGYDELRRLSTVTGGVADKTYTYRDITSSNTTTQVASVTYDLPTDQSFAYTYDSMGNIATYTDANGTVTYIYDAQNQLLSAVNGDTTYAYTYDTVGNILSGNGHTYTYGDADWKDLLTAVDGQSITYDAMGNPTSYYNGTRWTFTWAQGRRLTTASDGTNTVSYTYDADGLRTSKTVNGTKHTYYYAGGRLLRETFGSNTLDFFYDSNGNAYALKYNGTLYYYITNLQGDVMSIVDGQGAVVANYNYDPYGNLISDEPAENTVGHLNPLRYRAYYYDSESSLYYLQSRYYDPEIGRFINADNYVATGQGMLGNNMYVYCLNNPVVFTDSNGNMAIAAENVVEWWTATMWWLCLVDAFLPVGEIVYAVGIVGVSIFCSVAMTGSEAKSETKAEVVVATVTAEGDNETLYTVYFLYAIGDPYKAIIYVGRVKTENYASRMSYHASVGRAPAARIDGLTYEECRFVEQAGMVYYHTIGRGEPYKNQIRGISPTNPKIEIYLKSGYNLIQSRFPDNSILPPSFLQNWTENELLNAGC